MLDGRAADRRRPRPPSRRPRWSSVCRMAIIVGLGVCLLLWVVALSGLGGARNPFDGALSPDQTQLLQAHRHQLVQWATELRQQEAAERSAAQVTHGTCPPHRQHAAGQATDGGLRVALLASSLCRDDGRVDASERLAQAAMAALAQRSDVESVAVYAPGRYRTIADDKLHLVLVVGYTVGVEDVLARLQATTWGPKVIVWLTSLEAAHVVPTLPADGFATNSEALATVLRQTGVPVLTLPGAATVDTRQCERRADLGHSVVLVSDYAVDNPPAEHVLDEAAPYGLVIYGTGWGATRWAGNVAGTLPPDRLCSAYRSATVVLALSGRQQQAGGMVDTSVFDVLAAGGLLHTDAFPAAEAVLSPVVATFARAAGDTAAVVQRLLSDPSWRAARLAAVTTAAVVPVVSVSNRLQALLELYQDVGGRGVVRAFIEPALRSPVPPVLAAVVSGGHLPTDVQLQLPKPWVKGLHLTQGRGAPLVFTNPAVASFSGRLLVVLQHVAVQEDTSAGIHSRHRVSRLFLARLDGAFHLAATPLPVQLSLGAGSHACVAPSDHKPNLDRVSGLDGGRLFHHDGRVFVAFSARPQADQPDQPCNLEDGLVRQFIAEVHPAAAEERAVLAPPVMLRRWVPGNRAAEPVERERHWVPFSYDASLYMAVSLSPHVVCKVHLPTGDCEVRHSTSAPPSSVLARFPFPVTGGAPAILVADSVRPYFLGVLHTQRRFQVFENRVYTFEARPPFRVLAVSRPLPVTATPRYWSPAPGSRVAFVTGMERVAGDVIVLSFGSGEHSSFLHFTTLQWLEAQLIPLRPPALDDGW